MKLIKKKAEPAELKAYKKSSNPSYIDLIKNHSDIADIVRLSLTDEQGYICCYCGRQIDGIEHTRIEHIYPKGVSEYSSAQLDYENNLVAACDGGLSNVKADPSYTSNDCFCDRIKADKLIPITPLNPVCEKKFLFDENGEVIGVGSDAEITITLLNLNSPILQSKRKAAIKYYIDYPVLDWQIEYDRLSQKDSQGKFEEFCFVLQNYIMMNHSVKTSI